MPLSALQGTYEFYQGFWYFFRGGEYISCPYFKGRTRAKIHVYSLALTFYMWDKPHYRTNSFQEDLLKNLRNVAVPGTGVTLSLFCIAWPFALFAILYLYPLVCFLAAIHRSSIEMITWQDAYVEQLLEPRDWFSFWRLNCSLASLHSMLGRKEGYEYENKWTFLVDGKSKGIPVSPFLDIPSLVMKDKNEEGGMGIYFYDNAANGGDWVIQERLHNDEFVSSLLPENAPLSTMRITTASRYSLEQRAGVTEPQLNCVKVLSCVFRAGRARHSTDHGSILFDVDMKSGTIKSGTTNDHWYKLGIWKCFSVPWISNHKIQCHPDTKMKVEGATFVDIKSALNIVKTSHFKMLPKVPLVGWDVAFTPKGVYLLEVNLSCNFFQGTFDLPEYVSLVDDHFSWLDTKRH